ncbi:MAG: flagellar hook assembly protein FlgD [Desulfovibrio sp.]|jgi:flagellar basal-body rod modification protein FlgD|nr:flagellar hook assembly protein FlgD [Desulfovibrio sp.]
MSLTASSSLLGQYESGLAAQATSGAVEDKDMFLKLLIAQLTHQDPLNPVEDKEFIAQLAQFTSVEELQKISSGVEEMNGNYVKQQVTTAASFMGLRISAKGDLVSLTDATSSSSYIYAEFPRDAASAAINIYATDAEGNPTGTLVYSESLGAVQAGTQQYSWNGYASNGARCPAGTYVATFSALDGNGQEMLVGTSSIGVVVGVETSADGNHYLYLEDGRKVRLNDIELISYAPQAEEGSGTEEE